MFVMTIDRHRLPQTRLSHPSSSTPACGGSRGAGEGLGVLSGVGFLPFDGRIPHEGAENDKLHERGVFRIRMRSVKKVYT